MLKYSEAEASYRYWDHSLKTVRRTWDNYSGDMKGDHGVLRQLAVNFPDYRPARIMRPLGDFKDLDVDKIDRRGIYQQFLATLRETRWSKTLGKDTSMLDVAIDTILEESKAIGAPLNRIEAHKGLSLMLYRSTMGIVKEVETYRALKRKFAHLEDRGMTITLASAEDESRDIDAMLVGDDGAEIVKISIKNGKALTHSCINAFRRRGKTEPHVYVGMEDGKLRMLYPTAEGKAVLNRRMKKWLRTRLGESLQSGVALAA